MGTITDLKIVVFPQRQSLTSAQKVRGGRLIMDMNSRYLIISPESSENCFYHCLAYCVALTKNEVNKIQDNSWVKEYARDLKRRAGNTKDFSDLQDVQTIADSFNCSFTIYDNLFSVITEIKSKESKKNHRTSVLVGQKIRLQFKRDHCHLMIPKSQNLEFT